MTATEKLHPLLGKRQGGISWHDNPALFPSVSEGPRGTLNLSPAWFQLGHEVSRRPARSRYPRLTHKRRASYGHALGLSDWRLVI